MARKINTLSLKQRIALMKWLQANHARHEKNVVGLPDIMREASLVLGFPVTKSNFASVARAAGLSYTYVFRELGRKLGANNTSINVRRVKVLAEHVKELYEKLGVGVSDEFNALFGEAEDDASS